MAMPSTLSPILPPPYTSSSALEELLSPRMLSASNPQAHTRIAQIKVSGQSPIAPHRASSLCTSSLTIIY